MPKILVTPQKGLFQESGSGTLSGHKIEIKKITANAALLPSDSGKVILCNPAANTVITLPTISSALSGWNCTIIATEDAAGADEGMNAVISIDLGSGTNLANIGQIHEVDGGAGNFAAANDDFIVVTAAGSPGDRFEILTDGTRWYVQGYVKDLTNSDFSTNAVTIA
jgi:hypothetical protein